MTQRAFPPLSLAWAIWALGALFYLTGFFQRVAPAVMTEELMRDFHISAAGLGNLSAFYFYSYVAMQIPTGIAADLLGPRRLLSAGALVAALGTALFAVASDILWANLGRFLIGGSVAVAFVGLLRLANNWFPARLFAMVTGMALFVGIVGAVSAGPPLRLLMNHFDWRLLMLGAAAFSLALSLAIWFLVRDNPREKGYADRISSAESSGQTPREIITGLAEVFKNRNVVLLFIIPGGIVGCVLTFSGLWGVPYLSTHQSLSTAEASGLTSLLLVAWALGGPFLGWLSDRLGKRKPLYLLGCTICLAGWCLLLFVPDLPLSLLVGLLVLTGFSSGCMIVSFAFAKESLPPRLAGTVAGVVNMGVMLGPMLLQPGVGLILDWKWKGNMQHGVKIYGLEAYQAGFSLMLAWALLSLTLLLLTRETHCRQQA